MKDIFSILLKNSDGSYSHKGTGFLIGADGLFVSAGHVFYGIEKPCERFFCSFPSNASLLISIKSIGIEYKYKENQRGPVYRDIAIGKMNHNNETYRELIIKRPSVGTFLKIKGFVNTKTRNVYNRGDDDIIDLSSIKPEIFDTEVEDSFAIISDNMNDYDKSHALVDTQKKYNNSLTLKRYAHHGASGCPVVNSDEKVVGMFFGGPNNHRICHIITSKYINKKISKLKDIPCT